MIHINTPDIFMTIIDLIKIIKKYRPYFFNYLKFYAKHFFKFYYLKNKNYQYLKNE